MGGQGHPRTTLGTPLVVSIHITCFSIEPCVLNNGCGSRGREQGVSPPPEMKPFAFAFKICLSHQSCLPFLSGASPPKENLGSAPELFKVIKLNICTELYYKLFIIISYG